MLSFWKLLLSPRFPLPPRCSSLCWINFSLPPLFASFLPPCVLFKTVHPLGAASFKLSLLQKNLNKAQLDFRKAFLLLKWKFYLYSFQWKDLTHSKETGTTGFIQLSLSSLPSPISNYVGKGAAARKAFSLLENCRYSEIRCSQTKNSAPCMITKTSPFPGPAC